MKDGFREIKLSGNKPVIGFGVCLGSVRIAEMVGRTRFDYAMVDMQHGHFDKADATSAIRCLARSGGPVPIGRVANNDSGSINNLLDAGAAGIIVPMVESREEAEKAVKGAYYPPLGMRSKSSPAGVFYGDDYFDYINEKVQVIVMIETAEAAEKSADILSVPGVTACLIGASDLRFSMKRTGREEGFEDAVKKVFSSAKQHGVAVGISVGNPSDLDKWYSAGADFFLLSHDMGLMNKALKEYQTLFLGGEG